MTKKTNNPYVDEPKFRGMPETTIPKDADTWNLSDRVFEINYDNCRYISGHFIPKKDVKEFIRRLKNWDRICNFEEYMDKLAGEKLNDN